MTSSSSQDSLDEPLGLAGADRKRRGRASWQESGLLVLVALVILGGSTAIALRERPFRSPPAMVSITPETIGEGAVAEAPEAGEDTPAEEGADGPSIVRIDPERPNGMGSLVIRDPSTLSYDPSTAHLPDRDLLEEGEHGPLPMRGADGLRPFDAYARPWSGARGARVAIVIGGLGVSQTGTQAAIARLPAEVTLAFASGGNSLDRWMQTARREGHEIVMQVPLEPYDFPNVNPGRNTLTVDAPAEDNRDRLHWALSRITNYVGVMNYMGGRFVADRDAMAPLIEELGARGLMYFDDGSTSRSRAEELAETQGVPFLAGDLSIDDARERGEILERLDELERTARARGHAVATGSAFEVTIDTVAAWAAEARRRGIEIVPVSALAHDPESSG